MTPYHDIIDELLHHGTSTLCEASGLPCALDYNIRPVWRGAAVAGPAYPLRCAPGDNLAIHIAVDAVPPGHVLVVDASGYVAGYWGEVLLQQKRAASPESLLTAACAISTRSNGGNFPPLPVASACAAR